EGYLLKLAPSVEIVVDELPAVVCVQPLHGKRQKGNKELKCRKDPFLGLISHRAYHSPPCGHVGAGEGLKKLAAGRASIMGYQIHLDEARRFLVLTAEGP